MPQRKNATFAEATKSIEPLTPSLQLITRDAHGNEWNNCQFDGIIILRDTLESGDVTIENEVKGGCQ